MDRPLEISFHGVQGSPALEEDIRKLVAKLKQHCTNLVSCRVTLEASSGKGQPHGHIGVHIMLGLPGRDLAVAHEPHQGAVQVQVDDGWITLTGQLDWHYQRQAFEQDVRSMVGVIGVSNETTVNQPAAPATSRRASCTP